MINANPVPNPGSNPTSNPLSNQISADCLLFLQKSFEHEVEIFAGTVIYKDDVPYLNLDGPNVTEDMKKGIMQLSKFMEDNKINSDEMEKETFGDSKLTLVPKKVNKVFKYYSNAPMYEKEKENDQLLKDCKCADLAVIIHEWDDVTRTCIAEKCIVLTNQSKKEYLPNEERSNDDIVSDIKESLEKCCLKITDLNWGDNLGIVNREGKWHIVIFDIKSISEIPKS